MYAEEKKLLLPSLHVDNLVHVYACHMHVLSSD